MASIALCIHYSIESPSLWKGNGGIARMVALGKTKMANVKIRNIAHRGIWDDSVPQNTLKAFRLAWEAGATWVETDFHRTAAGQMVCIHVENELRRYTGCEKAIVDLTPEEVATLRLTPPNGEGERIPLLDEVLATVPRHGTLQAEIKGYAPDYPELFDAAVCAAGLTEENIVVSSFKFDALLDFHKRLPKYRTLFLLGVPKNGDVDVAAKTAQCAEAGFWAFCPGLCANDRPLTPDEADSVRATGMSFRVYGVNTPEALTVARDIGAEAFTCNHWRKAFEWAREIGGVELLA